MTQNATSIQKAQCLGKGLIVAQGTLYGGVFGIA